MPYYSKTNDFKLAKILDRSDYILELSHGQRKYSSSSTIRNSLQQCPSSNSEIFVGRIPKEIFEDELIPLFETIGKIFDLRLMIDPTTGFSRGYAFITYFTQKDALLAVEKFDNFEIRRNKQLKVKISVPNVRLFIGNIPKEMVKEEIFQEFQKQSPGLVDVIVYNVPNDRKRNRGFCFLEYDTHKNASHAKRKLMSACFKVWGAEILVDWAEPLEEPNEETMSKVKVLYVRNLQTSMSEELIKSIFEHFGPVERVKKLKDYAFVHFEQREFALNAMDALHGKAVVPGGMTIEISLAKPPLDKKRKEEILRNRERRLMNMMQTKSMLLYHNQTLSHSTEPQSSIFSSYQYESCNNGDVQFMTSNFGDDYRLIGPTMIKTKSDNNFYCTNSSYHSTVPPVSAYLYQNSSIAPITLGNGHDMNQYILPMPLNFMSASQPKIMMQLPDF